MASIATLIVPGVDRPGHKKICQFGATCGMRQLFLLHQVSEMCGVIISRELPAPLADRCRIEPAIANYTDDLTGYQYRFS